MAATYCAVIIIIIIAAQVGQHWEKLLMFYEMTHLVLKGNVVLKARTCAQFKGVWRAKKCTTDYAARATTVRT